MRQSEGIALHLIQTISDRFGITQWDSRSKLARTTRQVLLELTKEQLADLLLELNNDFMRAHGVRGQEKLAHSETRADLARARAEMAALRGLLKAARARNGSVPESLRSR